MTSSEADDPLRTTDDVSGRADEQPPQICDPNTATRSFANPQATGSFQGAGGDSAPSHPPARPAAVPKVAGYEIVGVLGRGGMGVVYKARHLALKRLVALKMILSGGHAGEDERQRFRSEAEAVARLQHPNIVQVHEVGEHDGLPYAALEFVEGGTFAQRLKQGPVPPPEAAELIATLAGAMHLAHSRNIVHRDLKPANILLDANGAPKVTDFGLARQLDADIGQTQAGAVVGTPSYMSPEQAAGESKDVGPPADVYALGAILYECLTGRPPFHGGSIVATLDMVRNQEPVAPHLLRVRVPADLETICLKCLRKEPEKRYASADALANDLRRWQRGEPIRARPVPTWERLLLWGRRRPALAVLLVTVPVLLAALFGGGTWSYWEINLALADADAEKLKADAEKVKSQRMSAGLALDQGLRLCQEGKVSQGMLWMAESLAINPEEDRGFANVVRLNLAAWGATMAVQRTIIRHEQSVKCVAYSPDGKTYLTAAGGAVRGWDALTGEPVGQALVHWEDVLAMAFSRDGRLLATGTNERWVRIWDVATGKPIGQPIAQPDAVNSVAFSQDGRWLLAATGNRSYSVDSSARVWEVATGKPVSPPLGHAATVRGGLFTPDGRLAITGGYDDVIRFWDTATWKVSGEPIKLPAPAVALTLSRDGLFLAVGCNNFAAFVYSVADRRLVSKPMPHPNRVVAICFHPDEGLVATGCYDSLVRLWDWSAGEQVCPPLLHQSYVNGVDFSPDGRRLISGGDDKLGRIWDLPWDARKGTPLTRSDPSLTLGHLDPSLISGRPRTRITGPAPGGQAPFLASARAVQAPKKAPAPIPHWVWEYLCASFSPDGRYVVTGSTDSSARVFEVATGRLIGKPLPHQNWVRAVAFALDNRHVLTGSHDMTAQLWDIHTGERIGPALHHAGEVVSVAISPDGTKALTRGGDNVRLWNLQTGEALGPPMLHTGGVASVSFSNNGAFALTGSGNGEARLWDSATALPIGPPARHHGAVTSVRFAGNQAPFSASEGARQAPKKVPDPFLTLCDDAVARPWPVPQPVAGDPALVKTWVQAITGEELDAGKAASALDAAAWRERRARVTASPLGANLEPPAGAVLHWHDTMAGAFEVSGTPETALWHLDRLLAARPMDWSLHARRAGVLHRYFRDAEARQELDRSREMGGLESVRGWCAERAENLERVHRHEEALWFHEWLVAADPKNPHAHDAIGHCKARLGQFAEASEHFTRAVALAPERIGYQRDLAMARLALDDRAGCKKACARMIALAETTADREAAAMTALTCVLDANSVPNWDAVIRLAGRAAEGYEGDYRIHVAALFRAGRLAEALQRPWSTYTKYGHIVWERLFQGMLRHQADRHEEARAILEQQFKLIDYMDRKMPRDSSSRIWSDWIYHVQCHVLGSEAEALLRRSRLASGTANGADRLWLAESRVRAGKHKEALAAVKDDPYGLCKLAGLFDQRSQAPFADEARHKALILFEQQLASEHHSPALACELANLLRGQVLSDRRARWTVLKPTGMRSEGGAALTLQDDGSILVEGGSPELKSDTLSVEAMVGVVKAIKIETSTQIAPKDSTLLFNEYQILTAHSPARAAGGCCTGRYVRVESVRGVEGRDWGWRDGFDNPSYAPAVAAIRTDLTIRPTGRARRRRGSIMSIQRVAIIYFDLYFNVDDGLDYRLPSDLRPCAWWAIDTHLDFDKCLEKAGAFDFVFAAQRDGARRLGENGITSATWLPLACDPEIHQKHEGAKTLDWCFVGNVFGGVRAELLELHSLQQLGLWKKRGKAAERGWRDLPMIPSYCSAEPRFCTRSAGAGRPSVRITRC